ncbi:MAG: hypothetical protein J0M17_17835 [Planctomycetes bacterium]|nr:hypothetical protein [Planctomycetota bacterium]
MKRQQKRLAVPHTDDFLFDLVDSAIETNGGYFIGIPKVISADKSILLADDMMERLADSEWQIEFRDERFEIIEFRTVICFLSLMENVKDQIRRYQEAVELGDCATEFKIHIELDERKVMTAGEARRLLFGIVKRK